MKNKIKKSISLLMMLSLFTGGLSAHDELESDNYELDTISKDVQDVQTWEDFPINKRKKDMASQLINYTAPKKTKSKASVVIGGVGVLSVILGAICSKVSGKFCFKEEKDAEDVSYSLDEFLKSLGELIGGQVVDQDLFKNWMESIISTDFFDRNKVKDEDLKIDGYGFATFINTSKKGIFHEKNNLEFANYTGDNTPPFLTTLGISNYVRVGNKIDNDIKNEDVVASYMAGVRTPNNGKRIAGFGMKVKDIGGSTEAENDMLWVIRTEKELIVRNSNNKCIALSLVSDNSKIVLKPRKNNFWAQLLEDKGNNTPEDMVKFL